VFTIGFKGRSAEDLFLTLKEAGIQKVIDVRRRSNNQLFGYAKGRDLEFFLRHCFGIEYELILDFAPSEELMAEYRKRLGKKKRDDAAWSDYVHTFQKEVLSRPITQRFVAATEGFDNICLLCAEETAERCHRRLLVEHFNDEIPNMEIYHL
jgi:uncharacterized protein (DUF488 family)